MIHNNVLSTRTIDKWMSFARPSYGTCIAGMELLTVHLEAQNPNFLEFFLVNEIGEDNLTRLDIQFTLLSS